MRNGQFNKLMDLAINHPSGSRLEKLIDLASSFNLTYKQRREIIIFVEVIYGNIALDICYPKDFKLTDQRKVQQLVEIMDGWELVWIDLIQEGRRYIGKNPILKSAVALLGE